MRCPVAAGRRLSIFWSTPTRRDALGPSELESLAEAAWWSGHPELRANSLERAHAAYVEAGDRRKAAQVAIELFDEAFLRLSHSVAVGWLKRAERLLEEEPEGPEHGYLELAYAFDAFFRRNELDEALPHLERVLEIGRRFKNSELEAMGLNLKGRVLVRTGDLNRGLALIDESTVAVVAGELGPQTAGNVYCSTISACRDMADWGRAVEATQQADRYMERRKITGYPGVCRVHRAEIKAVRGILVGGRTGGQGGLQRAGGLPSPVCGGLGSLRNG